jgi:hypothetical protein
MSMVVVAVVLVDVVHLVAELVEDRALGGKRRPVL